METKEKNVFLMFNKAPLFKFLSIHTCASAPLSTSKDVSIQVLLQVKLFFFIRSLHFGESHSIVNLEKFFFSAAFTADLLQMPDELHRQ